MVLDGSEGDLPFESYLVCRVQLNNSTFVNGHIIGVTVFG